MWLVADKVTPSGFRDVRRRRIIDGLSASLWLPCVNLSESPEPLKNAGELGTPITGPFCLSPVTVTSGGSQHRPRDVRIPSAVRLRTSGLEYVRFRSAFGRSRSTSCWRKLRSRSSSEDSARRRSGTRRALGGSPSDTIRSRYWPKRSSKRRPAPCSAHYALSRYTVRVASMQAIPCSAAAAGTRSRERTATAADHDDTSSERRGLLQFARISSHHWNMRTVPPKRQSRREGTLS